MLVTSVFSGAARAESWLAIVSAGTCEDDALTAQSRLLSERMRARVGDGVLSEEEVAAKLGPPPTHSAAELRRQLEAAQNHYYEGMFRRAEEQIASALGNIERLPVTPENWKLLTRARLMHGQVLRSMKRLPEAEAVLGRVLRLDPTYRLNLEVYPPAFQRLFEEVRRQVQSSALVPISVVSSQPGAEVFLDGWKVGKAPFFGRLPKGTYRLTLKRSGATSLPRMISLEEELRVQVDFEFEASVRGRGTPCVADKGEETARLSNAVKLGALLGVSEVVLVRIERQSTGPAWLSAALVSVAGGQKIREGGLKLVDTGRAAEGLEELANFIHTGQVGARVVARAVSPQPPDAPRAVQLDPRTLGAREPIAQTAAARERELAWEEPVGWVSGAAGVSLVVLGAAFQFQALGQEDRIAQVYRESEAQGQPALTADQAKQVAGFERQASAQQLIAIGGFGLGAALGLLSAYLLVW